MRISPDEIQAVESRIRKLSNRARYKEAYALARKYNRKYPEVLIFAYFEAVFTAEDTAGLSEGKANALFRSAARKLKRLMPRLRSASPRLRGSIRNEYYWFSKQPAKQYRLGVERGMLGYYSAGVGAAMLAQSYGLKGRKALALRWAKKSEKAWLNFQNKVTRNWFNSYMFFAMALGFQNRIAEMDRAIALGCKIAGKSKNWQPMRELRGDILKVVEKLY
jgi:hypothetical protein